MPLQKVMFYSGSILHDKAGDGSERRAMGSFTGDITQHLPEPVEEPAPLPQAKPENKSQQQWEQMQLLYQQQRQKFEQINLVYAQAQEGLLVAGQKDEQLRVGYATLLRTYCYLDYLRCIHDYLAEFMPSGCAYVLHTGANVLTQGSKAFRLFRSTKHIKRADGDQKVLEKLGGATSLGAFARTASVTDKSKFGYLGCSEQVRFIKKANANDYDAIPSTEDIPNQWQQVTCNGANVVDNKSSIVMIADMDAFIGRLVGANIGAPVYSISDCNSFHTSGYLWAMYALRALRGDQDDGLPVALLNFDQHLDAGAEGDMVASDRWGKPALGAIETGIYMSFGNASDGKPGLNQDHRWTNAFVVKKNGGGVASISSGTAANKVGNKTWNQLDAEAKVWYIGGILSNLRGRWSSVLNDAKKASLENLITGTNLQQIQGFPIDPRQPFNLSLMFTLFWQALSSYFGRYIKYVFVTVDRDAVQGHQTQWGDRCLFPNAYGLSTSIAAVVDPLFVECPGSQLIGFDITGLPEARVAYNVNTGVIKTTDEAWGEMLDELQLTYDWARRRTAGLPEFMSTALLVFSHLMHDLQTDLKPHIPSLPAQQIRQWFKTMNSFLDSRDKISAMQARIFGEQNRDSLQIIRDALMQCAKGKIPYESKQALSGYVSRINQMLEELE